MKTQTTMRFLLTAFDKRQRSGELSQKLAIGYIIAIVLCKKMKMINKKTNLRTYHVSESGSLHLLAAACSFLRL